MTVSPKKNLFFLQLEKYQEAFEKKLEEAIPNLGAPSVLREACAYALTTGGKRFRPALVLMVASALNKGKDAYAAALAVEYFHTASLIADDLPCMDNDSLRRNKPTVHKVYGETTALLASYALIAAGYGCIAENSAKCGEDGNNICLLALENAAYNTGLKGATGGQHIDLFPPNKSLGTIKEVIEKKTVSLFELAFVFGWLFGGGECSLLQEVKKCSHHLGMAFQIADDIADIAQDAEHSYELNMAAVLGKEQATEAVYSELEAFEQGLRTLQIDTSEVKALSALIKESL